MSITRKIVIGSAGLAGIALLAWLWSVASNEYQSYQWQKRTDALQEAMIGPYRTDTYGGKTPEETWAMFLDALKKKDVELASKYFEVDKQIGWKNTLNTTINANKLDIVIKNLLNPIKKDSSVSTADKAYYNYSFFDQTSGKILKNSLVFSLNYYTKVWKISVL